MLRAYNPDSLAVAPNIVVVVQQCVSGVLLLLLVVIRRKLLLPRGIWQVYALYG